MKTIKVPEFILKAARKETDGIDPLGYLVADRVAESVCCAIAENPIMPTEADVMTILQERVESCHITSDEYCAIPPATVRFVIRKWMSHMFLAPELEVYPELEFLIRANGFERASKEAQIARSAFLLGQQSKENQ